MKIQGLNVVTNLFVLKFYCPLNSDKVMYSPLTS